MKDREFSNQYACACLKRSVIDIRYIWRKKNIKFNWKSILSVWYSVLLNLDYCAASFSSEQKLACIFYWFASIICSNPFYWLSIFSLGRAGRHPRRRRRFHRKPDLLSATSEVHLLLPSPFHHLLGGVVLVLASEDEPGSAAGRVFHGGGVSEARGGPRDEASWERR